MAGTLRGMVHLPKIELIGVEVSETDLLLLLDCIFQRSDDFAT